MSLLMQLAHRFASATRQRGEAYFRGGRVVVAALDEFNAVALVRGSDQYEVTLQRVASNLSAACTCPYAEHTLCKHIWAALVATQDEDILQASADGKRVALSLVDPYELDEILDGEPEPPFRRSPAPRLPAPRVPAKPAWRKQLKELGEQALAMPPRARAVWPASHELLYVIDAPATLASGLVSLQILTRDQKKDGTWKAPKPCALEREAIDDLPTEADRQVFARLIGAAQWYPGADYYYDRSGAYSATPFRGLALPAHYRLVDRQANELLPLICATTRCRLQLHPEHDPAQWVALEWDAGEPWELAYCMQHLPPADSYEVSGSLRRGEQTMDLREPALILSSGLLFTRSEIMQYRPSGPFAWIRMLRQHGPLQIPSSDAEVFVDELMQQPSLPPIDIPQPLGYEQLALVPQPRLALQPVKNAWEGDKLAGELSFLYGETAVAFNDARKTLLRKAQRQCVPRNADVESAARRRLADAGLRLSAGRYDESAGFLLPTKRLPALVTELIAEGWQVEAQGSRYRSGGKIDVRVASGIDWFELHAEAQFGDQVAHLPELLAAVRKGEPFVRLGDGSFGVLPAEWLARHSGIAATGRAHEDHVRFARNQAGLLDALLAQQPQASCDVAFQNLRTDLQRFGGIAPMDPPPGFQGELRPYQRDALGWFEFLRTFGFGGCLADDMGLGKTVQVLALLEGRRELRERAAKPAGRTRKSAGAIARPPPSLIVVPRSLIFNWKQEAARFTPRLRVLDHTGVQRDKDRAFLEQWDVILTTYGTLRRDAADFMDVRFDYLILDESQAIKNPASESSKAARLLNADHRLALSGTPVENHLGELWSLFEFLNPGMLGSANVFKTAMDGAASDDTRKLLAHALRPFLLRRTKEQVARDLPARIEQTLYCELDTSQRKRYDELRDHYRDALLRRIETEGVNRSKIQILEALLRLRQAAIHPALIDSRFQREASAKLEMLLPRLAEIIEEGHKVLVFSQFTKMLGILRAELDRMKIGYEYLDGKTRDRESRVQRFQSEPDCRLFLVSLKAGGVGLNLTAAQYVFLLDPWWNPAVEAQAIDRAHRIGQTAQVFAYRLIARGTVEERILELQDSKRSLADAIVNADNALIRNLSKEDLQLLLA